MKRNLVETEARPGLTQKVPMNPVEIQTIGLFVQLTRALNQPPSIGEIYGLLFVSPRPMPQDDFIARLNLSKGSASQGLRYLLDLGAVRTVYVATDRRVHYEAVAELRNLVGRFLRQQVLSYFEGSESVLENMLAEAKKLPDDRREFATSRIRLLKNHSPAVGSDYVTLFQRICQAKVVKLVRQAMSTRSSSMFAVQR